jgi:hypothetical protein
VAADPGQRYNLLAGLGGGNGGEGNSHGGPRTEADVLQAAWSATQELLQWHMRTAERTLSGSFLDSTRGLVEARDTWR